MVRYSRVIIFAIAFALRFAIVLQLDDTAIFRTPQLDSIEYHTWAQRIAAGDFTWPAAPPHGPGYPFFLALLLTISRGSMFAVHVLQAIVGSATAVIIATIAKRLASERAGLLAGLLVALYGPLALVDVSILAEGLLVFLLSASLLGVIATNNRATAFFAGTALGLAIIVRPTAAILLPVYAFYLWRRVPRTGFAIFAIAVAYPVLPVLLHNWMTTRDVFAIQSGGGMNFYIGNSPTHDGTAWARPGGTWDWLRGEAWRVGIRGAGAEDSYYLGKTIDEIHATPWRFFALLFKKLSWLTQTEEIRDSHSFDFFLLRAPILRIALRFSILLPFAAFGIWVSRKAMPWILVAYLGAMSVTVVALVVGMRYRMPILPALFVFAGIGAASLVDRRSITQFAIVFVAVFALTHVMRHRATHELAEEFAMEGIALNKERHVAEAQAAFAAAIERDPMMSIAWTGRGDIALQLRKLNDAEGQYTQAMNVDPHNARAYGHLALVRAEQQDRTDAIALLREAAAIRPEGETLYNLSGLLFAQGDLDAAEKVLRDMLIIDPNDPGALEGLARINARRHRLL